MATVKFTIVDVFSKTAYKGNPLAVVENLDDSLTDTQMRLMTRQFNLSEMTLLMRPTVPGATYRLRSFLPDGKEVFGAGHNILGAWWYLASGGFLDFSAAPSATDPSAETEEFLFHQELGGSVLPVTIRRSKSEGRQDEFVVSIRQASPQSHGFHPDPAALAESIGLSLSDIGFERPVTDGEAVEELRPQVMSTSTTRHLLVPLSSTDALNRASVDRDRLLHQLALADDGAYGLYLFTPAEQGGRQPSRAAAYEARFFSPGMSGEDPATGSAAGPLSAYLYRHGRAPAIDGAAEMVVRQGLRIGRECIIHVRLSPASLESGVGPLSVDIAGSAVRVAGGAMGSAGPVDLILSV